MSTSNAYVAISPTSMFCPAVSLLSAPRRTSRVRLTFIGSECGLFRLTVFQKPFLSTRSSAPGSTSQFRIFWAARLQRVQSPDPRLQSRLRPRLQFRDRPRHPRTSPHQSFKKSGPQSLCLPIRRSRNLPEGDFSKAPVQSHSLLR
jgi:hypothetical protein